MKIGICGLGLIGGSLALAFKKQGETVYGYDIINSVTDYAVLSGTVDDVLNENSIGECDYIFVALYPQGVTDYVSQIADKVKKGTVVIDLCGTKATVCPPCFAVAEEHGFHFIGGHPMAGTQFSGLKYARANLFDHATMILVPKPNEDLHLLSQASALLKKIGFGSVTVATAEAHDRTIAFTSQLAHVVSNAYVKSPQAEIHKGFSAGSYRDLTRVAWLNEKMWTELFLANRENLVNEIDILIEHLRQYRDAVFENNAEALEALLRDGRRKKEEIDSNEAT
ncbi:MAG TPA: prephenate dehydrogenase/arogenate dehydrogenase family protein [Ruminococcaceae bacterium]|nr:prephenate dehydrogenase/arogenate dehydrogenase family protein [Oscillospiraceae bacterium]